MNKIKSLLGILIFLFMIASIEGLNYIKFETPGAIASLNIPGSWKSRYVQDTDMVYSTDGESTDLSVYWGPDLDVDMILQDQLVRFGREELIPGIVVQFFAGRVVASLKADTQVSEWWLVVKVTGGTLLTRGGSTKGFTYLEPILTEVIRSMRPAAVQYPKELTGSFQIKGGYDPGDGTWGLYSGGAITISSWGKFIDYTYDNVPGNHTTELKESEITGLWEVRGQRLLLLYKDDHYVNFKYNVYPSGVELWDNQNVRHLWIKKE